MRWLSLCVALGSIACSNGRGVHPDAYFGDVALSDAGARDAPASFDAGRDASSAARDAGRDAATTFRDGGHDAASSGGGLDPQLDVPPASNAPCTSPGSLGECAGTSVCRFFSATEGRCESCAACGNLFASCASGQDCDILFVCFQGQCTNFCTLGTSECGAPTDCIDIGYPTRGACRPH